MGALVPFAYGDALVRVIERDGDPWFVASDVARVLGYSHVPHMVRMLDDDEAAVHKVDSRSANGVLQLRDVAIISESGLYHAILKSRRADAKRFRKWVTGEILPSIRKRGSYHLPLAAPALPDPRDEELEELRQRVPSAKEEARRDRRLLALAHVEARMAEGATKTQAVAEAAALIEGTASAVWHWCAIVRMVPERDRGYALTPYYKGGSKFAECDQRLLEALINRASRPGAVLERCITESIAQAKRLGWHPIPHPRTMRRRIEALRAISAPTRNAVVA